jgi:hypothetical protein
MAAGKVKWFNPPRVMGSYSRKAVAGTFSSTYQQWNALVCTHSTKANASNTKLRVVCSENSKSY